MNIVDYIIIVILILGALKGLKNGFIPSVVSLIGIFLVFIIAFYVKQPVSVFLYENLPFIKFGGIFKGVYAINILFYEAIAYGITITILGIVFALVKSMSVIMDNILHLKILLNIPGKILGGVIGMIESLLFCFIILFVCSYINQTAKLVNDSKYGGIILNRIPIINNVTGKLVKSGEKVYNIVLKNENNTTKANLESIDVLMKYDILSYDSASKLVNEKKININGINEVIEKYKG